MKLAPINLSSFKQHLNHILYRNKSLGNVKSQILKLHFKGSSEETKVKLHQTIENEKFKIKGRSKPKRITEEQFSKQRNNQLTIVYNDLDFSEFEIPKDMKTHKKNDTRVQAFSFMNRKKTVTSGRQTENMVNQNMSSKSSKAVLNGKRFYKRAKRTCLVIEFEGTIGYLKCSDKGYIEFACLNNLNYFFKKLAKYFLIIVIFRKRNSNGFFKKMMDLVDQFSQFVGLFAVVNPFSKSGVDKFKLKAGGSSRISRKEKKKGKRGLMSSYLLVDLKGIEMFLPKGSNLIVLTALDKDVSKLKSRKGILLLFVIVKWGRLRVL